MNRYIGLDVHAQTCTLAVMNENGRRQREMVVETNGRTLIDAVKGIAGTRYLCTEEGTQSQWVYELLEPHVEELAVVVPEATKGNKSDASDAWRLADAMRTRSWSRRVFKSARRFRKLREATLSYSSSLQDVVRLKNRLKAVFRARGVATSDRVYEPAERARRIGELPKAYQKRAELLGERLDAAVHAHQQAEAWLKEESLGLPEVERVMTVPGIGPIRAAQIVAIVITPERFRTKRQFWSYCGLGLRTSSSADWSIDPATKEKKRSHRTLTRGLNPRCNKTLKAVFKGAAMSVIAMPRHPLRESYERLVAAGTRPNLARLTIARRIAAATLAVMKSKEDYDPAKHCPRAA